jgi:RNA polymerase sigma-70 factor, ECF subfamily
MNPDEFPAPEEGTDAAARSAAAVARAELSRRAARDLISGAELDDLAHQPADDALHAITTKLAQLRGNSRFTTWAYKFAVLEVSSKPGRPFRQRPSAVNGVPLDALVAQLGSSRNAVYKTMFGARRKVRAASSPGAQPVTCTAGQLEGQPDIAR